jgi:hypothetical protein
MIPKSDKSDERNENALEMKNALAVNASMVGIDNRLIDVMHVIKML